MSDPSLDIISISEEEVAKMKTAGAVIKGGSMNSFASKLRCLAKGEALKINKSMWLENHKFPPQTSVTDLREQGFKFDKMSTKDGIYWIIQRIN